jgi:hypothetical protein
MNKPSIISAILSLFFVSLAVPTLQAIAQDTKTEAPAAEITASSLTVSRMEIAGSVEEREPVGVAASFPATQEKVYCFVELKDIPEDTTITFVWSHGENEMDKITQQIKKSWRWRTWSNKTINGMTGEWKVDLMDESGAVLKSASFKVE